MASSDLKVLHISYEEIFPMWRDELWPDRQDPIRPMSSMKQEGGYDLSIYKSYQPFFFGLFRGTELVGCNSCHQTSEAEMRSRGLFIRKEFRGQGGSHQLLSAVLTQARVQGCQVLWSYPRKASLEVYLKFGFSKSRESAESPSHSYVVMKVNRP